MILTKVTTRLFLPICLTWLGLVLVASSTNRVLAQSCPEPSFHTALNIDSGLVEPFEIASADFNHDGNLDLVVGGSGPPSFRSLDLSVLLGNGSGSFEQPLILLSRPIFAGHQPGFAVGDFDGDGNQDIVLSERVLRFYYGDGLGHFRGPVDLLIPGEPDKVYAADLNNDGKSDLVDFASNISPFATILLSNTAGGFDQIPAPQFQFPVDLSFGDFNADGNLDLLGANESNIQVSLGDGAGHFAPQAAFGLIFTSLTGKPQVSDFNGDGKLDVAMTGNVSTLTIFFPGDGTGGFGPALTTQSTIQVQASADFNGDGKRDVAGYEPFSGIFRIGIGDGAGHFAATARRGMGGLSFGIIVGDFNNDSKSDLASINPRADDVSILFGDGAGGFDSGDIYKPGNSQQITAAAAGDFNGDGKIDFAVTDTSARIFFYDGNGSGGFVQGRTVLGGISYNYLATADFNRDGILDLVCASDSGNQFIIIFGGLDDSRIRAAGIPGANAISVGDFNGDGNLDIAASGFDSYGIMLGNGAGEFTSIQKFTLGTKPTGITNGDFNGDGKLDLALANQDPNTVSILIGDNTGTFSQGSSIDLNPTFSQPRTIVAADFNSDTKVDLAVANKDSNVVTVFTGSGSGVFGNAASYPVGGSPRQIVAKDVNLDGMIDLTVVNTRDNSNISILVNAGSSFFKRLNYGVGVDPRQLGFGDFNGDGKPDMVIANAQGNSVEVILSATCRLPDLSITTTHEGNFAVGVPGTYRMKVSNVALSRTLGPTVLTDVLPAGLSFISAAGSDWQCSSVGQTVTCTHEAPFEAGESSLITIVVSPTAGAIPIVINSASVSNPLDTEPGNDVGLDVTVVNLGVSISGRVNDENGNGQGGTTIVLSGAVNRTTTTSASGDYSFEGLPEGLAYSVTPTKNAQVFVPLNRVFKNLRAGGSGSFTSRSQTNGKIVLSRNVNGTFMIWTMNADGTGQTQLTSGPEFDSKPSWSPDGKKIIFQRGESVWVMDADGGNPRKVTPGEGISPVWSPNGQKIAFSKQSSAFPGIYTIDVDGSNEKRIFAPFGGFQSPLSWSPDGSRIAFTRQPPSLNFSLTDYHIYTMDVAGTSQTLIINNGNTTDVEPDFSPDGLKLVFIVFDNFLANDLAVANADGTGQSVLRRVSNDANPAWSPDGTKILFIDHNTVSTMNRDGSGFTNLSNSGAFEKDPDWQPIVITTGPNQIDDPDFFVRRHYLDFLNRIADPSGLAFWKNEITMCGGNPQCIDIKRINVSAAFYLSIEFQQSGYLVERIYKTAFGDADGVSALGGTHHLPVPIIRLNEFSPDTKKISQGVIVGEVGWETVLENNKQIFLRDFVERSRFKDRYPLSISPLQFVNSLNANAGNPLSPAERDQLVADLTSGSKSRAEVLRAVAEDPELNATELNRAFVLMQYFGYLSRNPNDPQDSDYTGYDFWLRKLNQFNGNFVNAEMVKAFITSAEYRRRFGL